MRKLCFFVKLLICFLTATALLPSCSSSSDDEPNGNFSSSDSDTRMLIGVWQVQGLDSDYDKNFIFLENNQMIHGSGIYEWQYNPETHILGTNCRYSWQINMLTEESWSGFLYDLFSNKNNGNNSVANRNTESVGIALNKLLKGAKWLTKDGKKRFPIEYYLYGAYFNDYDVRSLEFEEAENRSKIDFTIKTYEGRFEYTMYNPYNLKKVYIKGEGQTYYPDNFSSENLN